MPTDFSWVVQLGFAGGAVYALYTLIAKKWMPYWQHMEQIAIYEERIEELKKRNAELWDLLKRHTKLLENNTDATRAVVSTAAVALSGDISPAWRGAESNDPDVEK